MKTEEKVVVGGPDKQYRDRVAASNWQIQCCTACEKFVFPPRVACPSCGNLELEWKTPSGAGTVYSTTTMRRPAEAGGDQNLSLIDLVEGPRLMSRIVDADLDAIECGDQVQAFIGEIKGEVLVMFRPVDSTTGEAK